MAKKKPANANATLTDLSGFEKNLAIIESDLGESMLLFDQASQNVYALNVTAKIIWVTFTQSANLSTYLTALNKWFTKPASRNVAIEALNYTFGEFIKAGLILPKGGKFAGFPVGKEVRINQSAKGIAFKPATITLFTKEFLQANHPGLFQSVLFSDTWGLDGPVP